MECHIRQAKPSDCDAVVELIYSAGPELYDYLYQHAEHTALDFIAYQFVRDGGFCSHQWHYVAEVNGAVVGVVECYDAARYRKMLLPQFRDVFKHYKLSAWPRLMKRLGQVGTVISVPRASQNYIANLGVHPVYQGKGIGTQLIDHLEAHTKQRGYDSLSLDVVFTNSNAQRLYERLGFKHIKDNYFKGDEPNDVPNARLLVKPL